MSTYKVVHTYDNYYKGKCIEAWSPDWLLIHDLVSQYGQDIVINSVKHSAKQQKENQDGRI